MKSLLIIEDDKHFATALGRIAADSLECEVAMAHTMKEGVHLAAIGGFDAIILDLTLDDTNPAASVSEIDRLSLHAPVIVVTGETGESAGILRNWAIFNGATDFIQKDHIGIGHAWQLVMSNILNAKLRDKRDKANARAAA